MAEIFDILRFEVDKRENLTIPETYTEIANVTMTDAELGDYEYGVSMTHTFDSTTTSVYRRMSSDGGVTWREFILEPSDTTDNVAGSYNFFRLQVSGDLNIIVQARKETSAGTLIVGSMDAYIRRVR